MRGEFIDPDRSRDPRSSTLFAIITAFQSHCDRERPTKYQSFVDFARIHANQFQYQLSAFDKEARDEVGRHVTDAKRNGASVQFVPMMLSYLWNEAKAGLFNLLAAAKEADPFIGEFLDREMVPPSEARAHDQPTLVVIAARGRSETEAQAVDSVMAGLGRHGIGIETFLIDGANATVAARTIISKVEGATLTLVCLSKALMRRPWDDPHFQRLIRELVTREDEVAILVSDEPLMALSAKGAQANSLMTFDLSYGTDKLFEELSRALAKRRSGPDDFFRFKDTIRSKHAGIGFLETGLNPPIASAIRSDLALAIIDVDGMKNINRTFGEAVGDAVIRRIERTLRECIVEPEGAAGQCGDDAFYLANRGAHAIASMLSARDRLARIDWSAIAPDLWASVSIGVAFRDRDSQEPGIDVAIRAMLGMKKAKRPGSSGFEAGPELLPHTMMFERSDMLRRGFS